MKKYKYAIILCNKRGARNSNGKGIPFGHIGILIQDENENWCYFSNGKGYVQFSLVPDEYLTDMNKFSKGFYGGGVYTDSVYIKGDFSKSLDYYKDYYEKNKKDNNANYNPLINNCAQVVYNGLKLGELQDGTNIGKYMNYLPGIIPPKFQIDKYKRIFFNNAFTYENYHKQVNEQLWKVRHGKWYYKNPFVVKRLTKLF